MIDLSLAVLAGASLCVFVGAVIRGFTGFGVGIAATPLLVLLFPPAEIVPPMSTSRSIRFAVLLVIACDLFPRLTAAQD